MKGLKALKITAPLIALILSACASTTHVDTTARAVKGKGLEERNWKEVDVIKVNITNYAFTPNALVFEKGKPYKLEISNRGTVRHYFSAIEFVNSVDLQRLQFMNIATGGRKPVPNGEALKPRFTDLVLAPNYAVTLYFTPKRRGTFDLHCKMDGHVELGMVGELKIQ